VLSRQEARSREKAMRRNVVVAAILVRTGVSLARTAE
jgi:hypothetical protein